MVKRNNAPIITCPHCGAEYLPCEILYPNSFLGKATDIIKGGRGEIITFDGNNMETAETYNCDFCHSDFAVSAKVTFTSNTAEDKFDEEYSTPRYAQLSLFED